MIKIAKTLAMTGVMVLTTQRGYAQKTLSVSPADFSQLSGHWQGKLTYLDYTSNAPYTMLADLDVKQTGSANKFEFHNAYPKEPGANSVDTLTISNDGKFLGEEKITGRLLLKNGSLEIVTEVAGTDGNDNRSATIRHIYLLGSKSFLIIKEIQFAGEKTWIKRHTYNYHR